ncbi:MAG: serine O-acetyltransferase [Anaerolineales bacterium]
MTREDREPSLLALIREDWERHFRDWTKPGFRAMAMYRFGVWHLGIRQPLLRKVVGRAYKALHRYIRNHYGIELRCSAKVGRRLLIAHQGAIVIHGYAEIGDDCVIHQGVTIGSANDFTVAKAPRLADNVQVGAGAMVLGKVVVGAGARIGPNAVVMTNVPAGATVVAGPTRTILAPAESLGL